MLHSFIIPAFGESKYLQECIRSLQEQSENSEIIITTSTPNDFIQNTAVKFGIKLIINRKRESIAEDWNFAFRTASTRYVTLAHQDDYYHSDYVKYNLEKAEHNNDVAIQFSDYSEKRNEVTVVNSMKVRIKKILLFLFMLSKNGYKSKFIKKAMLSFGCPICCPSVFYNREHLRDFVFDSTFQINTDWDAWIRMSGMGGRFIYIKKKLVVHRVHIDSETSKNLSQRKTEDRRVFSELWFFPLSRIISLIYSLSYFSFK